LKENSGLAECCPGDARCAGPEFILQESTMLQKFPAFAGVQGPVVVIVMDGYGIPKNDAGSAIAAARKPTLDRLFAECPHIRLRAHGTAVGMPSDDDMGNSEVGHNAIGAGQVYSQGAALVANAIADGAIWQGEAWQQIVAGAKAGANGAGVIHFIGLFSDGNVHSHIDHLKAMVVQAKAEGIKTVRIHALLDGRDVPETSALEYVVPFEAFLAEISSDGFDARIASGGGRQYITMDRYDANWPMVEKGWKTHVLGEGPQFANATEAVNGLRERTPAPSTRICPSSSLPRVASPSAPSRTAIRWSSSTSAATAPSRSPAPSSRTDFDKFDRVRAPGDLRRHAAVRRRPATAQALPGAPPAIKDTSGEWFSKAGLAQFACSETQKFGHVTYFWNGNRSGKFDGETWQEVPSDVVPFEQRPWMKAAEITDAMIAALQSGQYKVLRCNYANGDMVGHTGNFRAATMAVEAVDLALARLLPAIEAAGGVALITADHGNADEMFELDKKTKQPAQNKDGSFKAKTAHTLNPVPLILFDKVSGGKLGLKQTRPPACRASPPRWPTCSAWRSTPSGTRACWK
jgi:2,3-bisphosphoglycerate-independent phosphoglycerate mutase